MEYSGDLRRRSFFAQDLAGAVYREADLYQATFEEADLHGASFLNCFAAEANFTHARCEGMRAQNTSFYRADFRGTSLREALLRECVLAGADLRGADLRQVTITLDCNSFEGIRLDRSTAAKLTFLLGRADSPLREEWTRLLSHREQVWLERLFQR